MKKIFIPVPFVLLLSCTHRLIETNLYFGLSKPNGDSITVKEWEAFRTDKIATTFTEGSSIIRLSGNWLDPVNHQLVTEPSFAVIYFHKNTRSISRKIDSLRICCKMEFDQQPVLRLDKKVKASF